MPLNQTLAVILGIGSVTVFFAIYMAALAATRPAGVDPAPATQDLPGAEPPAVVSLLAGGWELTEDAAEATLIDLTARHVLEFRQPGNEPAQTTVHIRDPHPVGLNPYEQRIFDRVRGLAVNEMVPLTALTFREPGQAKAFAKKLNADIIADARTRGLSRRRLGAGLLALLHVLSIAVGVAVGIAVFIGAGTDIHSKTAKTAFSVGFFTIIFLSALVQRDHGERDTPTGRAVAERWLGVRDWLRRTESFADLPPAAVAVWDRYLSYGDALGTTRVCAAVIDLGMGNRKRVWSSYGGTWHRVRVRYPRLWPRYGATALRLGTKGFLAAAIPVVLLYVLRDVWMDQLPVLLVPALLIMAYGLYLLARTLIDIARPVTLTGQVLWIEVWRSNTNDNSSTPVLYYLAVDDGPGDQTKAWALPRALRSGVHDGDTVTLTARPWSRRVLTVRVLAQGVGRTAGVADIHDESTHHNVLASMMSQTPGGTVAATVLPGIAGLLGLGSVAAQSAGAGAATPPVTPELVRSLLSPEEVARVVGYPVTALPPGDNQRMIVAEFRYANNEPAANLMIGAGRLTHAMIGVRRGDQPLPAIGDEAYTGEGWAISRRGDMVIMLNLFGPARQADPRGLHWLLATAVGRLPAPVG